MKNAVLVLNSGSSSLKYQLVDVAAGKAVAGGMVERIGSDTGRAVHSYAGTKTEWTGDIPDHAAALDVAERLFTETGLPLEDVELVAVGHRVVHGGRSFSAPVLIDERVHAAIVDLVPLAPLHNPANLVGIEKATEQFPGVPQVAVFDTAFFTRMPEAAATYAVDHDLAQRHRLRRYGFHGTSHQYVSQRVAQVLGRELDSFNQIVLHLGNGASASAVRGGVAVDTSMGLTPLEGLVMGTRSGDLDPGLVLHLLRSGELSVDDVDNLLNRRSGVLGLSGIQDFRDLTAQAAAGNPAAELALDVYCHRARKYVGAYHAVLGGADVITFTAGVGENSAEVRGRILGGLEKLGIVVDAERNAVRSSEARVISPRGAAIKVMVVPTDEELAIATAAAEVVGV